MAKYNLPVTFLGILMATANLLTAETRSWKNASGSATIEAEFLTRDLTHVKLQLASGKESRIEIAKLHGDDAKWLDQHHPLAKPVDLLKPGVFDTLQLGDSYADTLAKLKASKVVELTIAESLLGRTGMNGVFQIRHKVGGQVASLFFEWTDDNKLKEISIRTPEFPADAYEAKLAPCWTEFIELLSQLHGQPLQVGPKIALKAIPSGSMLSSHVWNLDSGGSALLGIGCENTNYKIVVRFTTEKTKPLIQPGSNKPALPPIDFDP